MDYSYYATPPIPAYGYMGMQQNFQGTEDLSLDKYAGNEQIDPTYIPQSYDGYRFAPPIQPSATSPPPTASTPLPTMGSVDSGIDVIDDRRHSMGRASSEEKESLTPAQSRRKAQNRAAQRAFRERKERHVKDLEAKLTQLENNAETLQSDNERLKQALKRMTTENEMLRGVTSSSRPSSLSLAGSASNREGAEIYSTGIGSSPGKGKLLSAGAAWDLIQSHPYAKQGLVDIADVCERLKGVATCDGQGPVYDEALVVRIVEESNRGGGDELI